MASLIVIRTPARNAPIKKRFQLGVAEPRSSRKTAKKITKMLQKASTLTEYIDIL